MSLGKRLFIGEAAAAPEATCSTDIADVFGDGYGLALYSLDYDASDASGNYDGTPTDVTFGVDGQINYGASFNGSSSNITSSASIISGNQARSISAWYKTTTSNTTLIRFGAISANEDWTVNITDASTLDIFGHLSANDESFTSVTPDLLSGDWIHMVVTYDGNTGGTLKLYIDGNLEGTINRGTGEVYNTASGMVIGERAGIRNFNGSIDQVRIFSKALSQNEVDTLYAETACVYTSTTDTLDYQGTNIAYYKLDGNALDETSNNYDGTEFNITYEFGRYGLAAVFNGADAYVNVTHNSSFNWTGNKTLSLWFKFDTLGSNVGIASKSGNTLGDLGWLLTLNGTNNKIGFNSYSSSDAVSSLVYDTAIVADRWYHICVTGDGTTNKLYINGDEENSASAVTGHNLTQNLVFGRYYSNINNNYFDGNIDQVRFYASTLDATEVANLYNEKQAYITKNASDPFGDNNELAFYELENNANDSTGSNTGAASNVTFTSGSGLFGTYAASFNGSSSNIQIDTLSGITNYNFTFSVWLKTTDSVGYAIDFRDPIYITIGTGLYSGGTNGMGIYDGTNSYFIANTAMQTINDGNWYHIVMTHDGTSLKGYLDGNIIGTVSTGTTTQFAGGTNHNRIGQRGDGSTSYAFQGSIDQFRIFDRALDGDEVFKLYAEVIN